MNRTYNAQFLTLDFRLLDDPRFCVFMRSSAFALYMLLRRYVWRGRTRRHPVAKVNELFARGMLVSSMPRTFMARKLRLREVANVSRRLAELVKRGLVRKVRTGSQNVYVLGTWEDRSLARDGRYVIETFFLEQRFGVENFDPPRLDDVAPEVSLTDTSDVSLTDTSDVSQKTPNNKETNREKKIPGGGGLQEVYDDDVIYVEY